MDELASSYGPDCPVVVVYRASQPAELVLRGTVADIADRVEAADLRQAAIILVGRALAQRADPEAGESFLYDPTRERSRRAPDGDPQ
jgi:precorrin-4/cobalt-precorrin-4 C11-methyltransferase